LLPVIERVVAPGSVIISDERVAYAAIPNGPGNYTLLMVNHSRQFVNPVNRAHTNSLEAYWSRTKAVSKRMNGTRKEMVPGYVDEFMLKKSVLRWYVHTVWGTSTFCATSLSADIRVRQHTVYFKRPFSGSLDAIKETKQQVMSYVTLPSCPL